MDIEKIKSELPNIDCGACGAPNCRAFAEDVVTGKANGNVCPILESNIYKGEGNDSK